jgi:hypothetical protein
MGAALPSAQPAIETKMNMPRPAAVAQWLAEQGDVEIQGPRSTGVIVAIAALATLCVMGVASLIYYKLKLPAQTESAALPVPVADPAASGASADSTAAPKAEGKAGGNGNGNGNDGKTAATEPATEGGDKKASPGGPAKPAKEEDPPGRLTIVCKPACDNIVAGGAALGPGPVFNHAMPPGTHRVTCTAKGKSKTVVVQIVSGQATSHTVVM